MNRSQVERFLARPLIAKLATVRKNGAPFVVPVWYDWKGGACYVVGRKRADWVKHVVNEPRVTVLIDEDSPPYAKVTIEGKAEIIGEALDDWIEIGKRMVKKYYGPDAGVSYLEGSMDQPRKTIRITPTAMTSWITPTKKQLKEKPRLSWATRYYEPGTKWYKEYRKDTK